MSEVKKGALEHLEPMAAGGYSLADARFDLTSGPEVPLRRLAL